MSVTIRGTDNSASTPAVTGTDGDTGMFFPAADTIAFAEGGTEVMRVTPTARVCIGTSEANAKLNVYDPVATTASSTTFWNATYSGIYMRNTNDTVNAVCGVSFSGGSSGNSISAIANITETLSLGALAFYTGGQGRSNSVPERMRITSGGHLLVNTSTTSYGRVTIESVPFDPFSSNWSTSNAITVTGGYGGGMALVDGSAGYTFRCQDSGRDFYIQGGNVSGSMGGGVFLNDFATSWSSASDENVKDIIEPITDGLQKVVSLRAVIGKYKDEAEGKRHPFLIAQDVQKVLPEAVCTMNRGLENECLGLSYTDTIPLLVSAIQELKAELDTVKAELQTIKGATNV